MTSDQIAMQVYATLCDHYETDDGGYDAESARWVQLIERCGLTMDRARGVASEVCGQHEALAPARFFQAYESAAFLATKVTKEREKTGPRKCGYCRDTGFATIYHRRNPELTECVGCQCSQGQKVLAAELEAVLRADPKNMHARARFSSAVEDPSLFDPIRLYHRHQTENSRAWAKRNGLEGKDESQFVAKYREILEEARKGMFRSPGRPDRKKPTGDFAQANAALAEVRKPRKPNPPPQLDPDALAHAVYANGDDRGEFF